MELHSERERTEKTSGARRVRAHLGAAAKRIVDTLVAASLLILLAPLFVVLGIVIKAESSGPIFYRAERVGRRGAPFRVLKFRKMHHGASGQALTADADARFTRIGRWLARTKLDELPQLVNVLLGQMSLVGPRPEDARFTRRHSGEFVEIHRVRPGITGLGQLAFAREAEILDPSDRVGFYEERILPQKVHLDTLYAQTRTMRGDLRILLWTVLPVILRLDVAVNRQTGTLTIRRREADSTVAPS